MNPIKYLWKLKKEAEERGEESPTKISVISPTIKLNRKARRKADKQAQKERKANGSV